jgi:Asp/Glu/hydantoin racemase
MSKKIAVIHTSLVIRESIDSEIKRVIPDATICNIIEETWLKDVMEKGGITPNIIKRMCLYVQAAEAMGANVILNACSSVGEAFSIARKTVNIPTVKIDEPMAEIAVTEGNKIAVFGTVATTLTPSCRLIEETARNMNKEVEVTAYLIDGAFKVLSEENNSEKHNQMVLEKIHEVEANHDVIVLAQASMTILASHLQDLGKPVLYSLETGIQRVKEILEQ